MDGLQSAKLLDSLTAEYEITNDITDEMLQRVEQLSKKGIQFLEKVVDKNLIMEDSDECKSATPHKQKHTSKIQLLASTWFRMCVLHPSVLLYSFMQLGFLSVYLDG